MVYEEDTEIERAMCNVCLGERKEVMDLRLMSGFNEVFDQVAKANCVHWYGHVLRWERNGHVLANWLDSELVGCVQKIGRAVRASKNE